MEEKYIVIWNDMSEGRSSTFEYLKEAEKFIEDSLQDLRYHLIKGIVLRGNYIG